MSADAEILCFQCGQKFSDPPEVPLLESGEPCPSCTARLLELLPAPLPQRAFTPRSEAVAAGGGATLGTPDADRVD